MLAMPKHAGMYVTVAATLIAAIAGFMPAVKAWDELGLPTMATRGWVRDTTGGLSTDVKEMRLDGARGKRDANIAARNALELTVPSFTDPIQKIKAEQEIRRLDETVSALNEQIRSMTSLRGPQ